MTSLGDKPASEITFRDKLILAALQGLVANPRRDGEVIHFTKDTFLYADAVIAALDKEKAKKETT